jgi:hypothetical protein
MNPRVRGALFIGWALVGVPLFAALVAFFGTPALGVEPQVALVAWVAVMVLSIYSGLRALLFLLPHRLLLRIALGAVYVAAAYVTVLAAGLIGACANGCA